MKTLHRFRRVALVTALATGALIASGAAAGTRDANAALAVAELGTMTVHAPRLMNARIADLGALTVTARRSGEVVVAAARGDVNARPSVEAAPNSHSWN